MIDKIYTTTTNQRDWLRRFTSDLQIRLKDFDLPSLSLSRRVTAIRAPYSDGWCSEVGTVAIPGISSLEAFVDTMTAKGAEPKLWVGIFVTGKERVKSLARHVTKRYARVTTYPDSAFMEKDGHTYYNEPFSKRQYGRPNADVFGLYLKDIGMYFRDGINWNARPSPQILRESSTFLAECVSALETFSPARNGSDDLFHNRQVWVTSKVFRRSSPQALDTLKRDGFKCQTCLTIPERKYGIEGRACLDAHHVEALHARKGKRTTSMRQLITVCANCHRVLGKLSPDRRGLAELRRRLT